jgi:hypothetical protein
MEKETNRQKGGRKISIKEKDRSTSRQRDKTKLYSDKEA